MGKTCDGELYWVSKNYVAGEFVFSIIFVVSFRREF
jgi:hypothetical protein